MFAGGSGKKSGTTKKKGSRQSREGAGVKDGDLILHGPLNMPGR